MITISCRDEEAIQRLVAQIARRVKEEVIHTFLSEMGIQRLEAIIEKAKENRQTLGHNCYTSLAEAWAGERIMAPSNPFNPYRTGSKLHDVFHFISDGGYHTLVDITNAVYFPGAGARSMYRRRVASALRTIRQQNSVEVRFTGTEYHFISEETLYGS